MNRRQVYFKHKEVSEVAGTTTTDKKDLANHRVESFEMLGFSKKDSKKLADAKKRSEINGKFYDFPLSWHDVKKMLDNGCTHELALKILL